MQPANQTNDSPPTPSNPAPRTPHPAVQPHAAALWASAFLILALIIVQAGRTGGPVNNAYADVNSAGNLQIITTQGSAGEDLVVILDQRDELLFVYGIEATRRIQLLQMYSVPQVFSDLAGNRNAPPGGGAPR